ncbi:hypothetical protein ABW18_18640 [Gordonia jacobaea]|uniref:Uncharacterized protein n=1 Tax=Gordonia jacobaea TaxID=122202 RepID=A0ABR5I8T7_9ACTN|nr:hypothetical protein ABW18_18640 [Gordonia jacobaea]
MEEEKCRIVLRDNGDKKAMRGLGALLYTSPMVSVPGDGSSTESGSERARCLFCSHKLSHSAWSTVCGRRGQDCHRAEL